MAQGVVSWCKSVVMRRLQGASVSAKLKRSTDGAKRSSRIAQGQVRGRTRMENFANSTGSFDRVLMVP